MTRDPDPLAPLRFDDPKEQALAQRLLEVGWIQQRAEQPELLERIRQLAAGLAAAHLDLEPPEDVEEFLETLHRRVPPARLNALRLAVFHGMNERPWLRPAVYRVARQALHTLVGNELAMQRRVNLSIQMPGDDSSLLPVHADSWSGDSPYELVLWVPLVDCRRTQSLFLLPREEQERCLDGEGSRPLAGARSPEDLFRLIEPHVRFLDIDTGEVLLFDQNLLHGNRINRETTTRWSLNCRFKGLFTPYADKKLGEFFEPITVRPMSRLGMQHRFPGDFETP